MAGPKGSRKMAVLLCKFKDEPAEPQPRSYFEDLFINRGTGGLNDYWRAASIGAIDLDGTQVFGWNTINQNRKDYLAANPDRWSKILNAFPSFPKFIPNDYPGGHIAVFNSDVGDSGTHNGILVNVNDYTATFCAHETGHILGLAHSFDESGRTNAYYSAPGEYFDTYDIMSAMNVSAASSKFSKVGPLACAPHLDRNDWLPPGRVWSPPPFGSDCETVDLVSLGHPEVDGYLAAKIDDIYVEFRTKDGFDAGIAKPAVLIHRMVGGSPFVLAADKTTWDNHWLPGMTYPDPSKSYGVVVHVKSFDLKAQKARITICNRVSPEPVLVGRLFGGIARGGEGLILLPSGKLIRIPPRSPLLPAVSALSLLAEEEQALGPEGFGQIRSALLERIAKLLDEVAKAKKGPAKKAKKEAKKGPGSD